MGCILFNPKKEYKLSILSEEMCCKIISREPKFNFTCVTTKLCPRAVVSSVNGLTWSPLSSLSVIMPFPRTTNTSSICVLNARYPQRLTSSFRSKPKSLQRNNYFGYDHWSYFDIIGTHIFGTAVLNDQKSPSFLLLVHSRLLIGKFFLHCMSMKLISTNIKVDY